MLATGLLVAALDRWAKQHALTRIAPGERVPFGFDGLAWVHSPSSGGAFGLLAEWPASVQHAAFALLSLACVVVIASFYRGLARGEVGSAAALGAVLGGVLANAFDRFRLGHGLDVWQVGGARAGAGPDFNLAEVAIALGAVALIIELFAAEIAHRLEESPRRR